MRPVSVYVTAFSDRPKYQLQWKDPITGRTRTRTTPIVRSSGQRGRREAERLAAELERKLRDGGHHAEARISWESFRARYENEVLPGLAKGTEEKVGTVFNHIESILNPRYLSDLDEARLSHFAATLRSTKLAETTIKSYLAHLGSALNWAVLQKLLAKAPALPRIRRVKRSTASTPMKGRPVTLQEFERMLDVVPLVVGDERAAAWRHCLRGLWEGGLRLREAVALSWEPTTGLLAVPAAEGRWNLLIPADGEKGHKDRIYPTAPEFAILLSETPVDQRIGRVFKFCGTRRKNGVPGSRRLSEIISEIGERAGVRVRDDGENVKYASAHDLRRSFGERWAMRIPAAALMELMRHESIQTTLRYYIGRNADRTSDVLWAAHNAAKGAGES